MIRVIFVLLVAIYSLKASNICCFRQELLQQKLCILKKWRVCTMENPYCENEAITDCMEIYIQNVGKALSQGVEELDIPKYEPYDLRESYWTTFNWNAYDDVGIVKLTNISISGISNFTVTDFQYGLYGDKPNTYMYFVVHYSKLYLTAKCYLNGTFGSFLNSRGDKLQVTLKDFDFNVTINGWYRVKDEIKYSYINDVVVGDLKLVTDSLNLSFTHDSANLSSNKPYNWDWTEYNRILWMKIAPDIQMAAAKFIKNIAKKINHNSRRLNYSHPLNHINLAP